jgi:hypothetical protein
MITSSDETFQKIRRRIKSEYNLTKLRRETEKERDRELRRQRENKREYNNFFCKV